MNVTNIFLKTLNDDGEIGLYDLPLDDPKHFTPITEEELGEKESEEVKDEESWLSKSYKKPIT